MTRRATREQLAGIAEAPGHAYTQEFVEWAGTARWFCSCGGRGRWQSQGDPWYAWRRHLVRQIGESATLAAVGPDYPDGGPWPVDRQTGRNAARKCETARLDLDLVHRLWVQHETGQVLDASQIDLADEPVTRLVDVIEWWRTHRFE